MTTTGGGEVSLGLGSILWGCATFLQIGAVATNAPIIWVTWSKGLLRTPSTRLVFSLCLSHLLLCLFLLGSNWIPKVNHVVVDLLTTLSVWVVQLASLASVTLIALDRYISIARPMECRRILTPPRALAALGVVWSASILFVFPAGLLISTFNIYFALLLGGSTLAALTLMTLAYSHIFTIAREKCRTVRLGEFRRATASISSEWGTSVGLGGGIAVIQAPPSLISPPPFTPIVPSLSRGPSSQSLLQRLLQQRQGSTQSNSSVISVTSSQSTSSPANSVRSSSTTSTTSTTFSWTSTSSTNTDRGSGPGDRRRWRAYLRHNYNSPRKTITTILALLGSVVLCSLPIPVALVLSLLTTPPTLGQLYFGYLQSILLPLSSLLHPLLYGLLNRAIRSHLLHGKRAALPRSLRRPLKKKKKQKLDSGPRKVSTLGELRTVVWVQPRHKPRHHGHKKKGNNNGNNANLAPPSESGGSRRGSLTATTCTSDDESYLTLTPMSPRERVDTGCVATMKKYKRPEGVVLFMEEEDEVMIPSCSSMNRTLSIEMGIVPSMERRKSSRDSGAEMEYFSEEVEVEVDIEGKDGQSGHPEDKE